MRKWIVAGNWKMHNTIAESVALAKTVREGVHGLEGGEIVIAPPFTALKSVSEVIQGSLLLAAQNMHHEEKGAFTGEISPLMLKDVGCTYVIVGHSERRKYFHEKDHEVNLKVKKAVAAGLIPIMCVGETDDERNSGVTNDVVGRQVKLGLEEVEKIGDVVIAYEPVWAIGTGKIATPEQAQEVHSFIRCLLQDLYGETPAGNIRILYGGSVTKDNIGHLIAMDDIDGALVGGASLKADGFLGIIENVAVTK